MPTITAQSIIDRAELLLHDNTNVRWTAAELLNWLNEAQREIVLLKPDAYAINESKLLTTGTKQTIPASGTVLIDVLRNMGTGGTTAGNVIRLLDRRVLDDQIPGWHAASQVASVDHYVFDVRDPKTFYVYPPSNGTGYVEIIYAKAPSEVAAIGNTITLDDIYSPALLNYIMYRGYSKDADYAENAQRAMTARSEFLQLLGRQDLMEAAFNPNFNRNPQERQAASMAAAQAK